VVFGAKKDVSRHPYRDDVKKSKAVEIILNLTFLHYVIDFHLAGGISSIIFNNNLSKAAFNL